MVTTPTCTYCEQFQSVLMVTNMTDGDTQCICGNDILMWALSFTASVTEGMTVEQAEAYGAQLDQIKANDPRELRAAKRGRGGRTASAPAPDPGSDGPELASAGLVALPEPCPQCGGTTGSGDDVKLVCADCGLLIATADQASA